MATQIESSMDDARILVAQALFEKVTHLAVGSGPVNLNTPIDTARHTLQHEIGRAVVLKKAYVIQDPTGPIVIGAKAYRESVALDENNVPQPVPTNLLYFVFRFASNEGLGAWSEYGLYGDGVTFLTRGATLRDGSQGGDDRANRDVTLGGAYTGAASQTITLTVLTGGGTGVAVLGWAADGATGSGSATVNFGVPITLPQSGLTVALSGGVDGVLSQGDQWIIQATRGPQSTTYAAGGVYDPVTNPAGQVRTNGRLVRLDQVAPPDVKGNAVLDVELVHPVLNDAP